jgi:catechol 2,3-dioxygenase-like lactoylglutathione lyase family enzyme
MIRGVKFVSIPVADQDRALAFYTDVLGFRLLTDQPFNESNAGWNWALLAPTLGLCCLDSARSFNLAAS